MSKIKFRFKWWPVKRKKKVNIEVARPPTSLEKLKEVPIVREPSNAPVIRSFINFIKYNVYEKGEAPPNFDNEEAITEFLYYGDGRGIKESASKNTTLDVLYEYKKQCMVQFNIANMAIRQLEMLGVENTVTYKDGDKYRIIHTNPSTIAFGVGERFIIEGDQTLTKGQKVKGWVYGRKVHPYLSQTDIIHDSKK